MDGKTFPVLFASNKLLYTTAIYTSSRVVLELPSYDTSESTENLIKYNKTNL